MELLAEITERSLGLAADGDMFGRQFRLRKSARGIVLNDRGEMAVQHLRKYGFCKLPGGGAENNERITQTLEREILEEVGCAITITGEVGVVIEYRGDLLQISYCYTATVQGEVGVAVLDEAEKEAEQTNLWMAPTEFLSTLQGYIPNDIGKHFMRQREMTFVERYLSQRP